MSTRGFTCNASSEYSLGYTCSKAYDSDHGTEWAAKNEGPSAWIEIQLPEYAELSKIEIRNRNRFPSENFKDITLSFADGTSQPAHLTIGLRPEWNIIALSPSAKTNSVKISATSVHGAHVNPGFSEIRFYSCASMT